VTKRKGDLVNKDRFTRVVCAEDRPRSGKKNIREESINLGEGGKFESKIGERSQDQSTRHYEKKMTGRKRENEKPLAREKE